MFLKNEAKMALFKNVSERDWVYFGSFGTRSLTNMKAVIFCRVSSREQEETGYSLQSQEKLLREYGERNYQIDKVFSIAESAGGDKQRRIFRTMIDYIVKNNIKILICEKVDRLTRNMTDGVEINAWMKGDPERQVHMVKENTVFSSDSRSTEKFLWNMKISVAQYYIDNLSEEVKKGQKEKISQGWLPTKSPPGYKTVGDKGHKIHVIDELRAPLVRKMFELYDTGNYSLRSLTEKLYLEGLRNDNGNKIVKSRIHKLLTDPFFIGKIRWNNEIYDGKHNSLISEDLFSRVEKRLKSKSLPKYSKHFYLLKGLVNCFSCNGIITWEIHKGIVYGYCNQCRGKKGLIEEKIDQALAKEFNKLQVKNLRLAEWIKKALKEAHAEEINYHNSSIQELNNRQGSLKIRLDRLYDEKLDNNITEEFYKKKFSEYSQELNQIVDKISKHNNSKLKNYDLSISIFDISQKASYIYLNSSVENKRKLLNLVFTSLVAKDGEINAIFTKPFEYLYKAVNATNSNLSFLSDLSSPKFELNDKIDLEATSSEVNPQLRTLLRG